MIEPEGHRCCFESIPKHNPLTQFKRLWLPRIDIHLSLRGRIPIEEGCGAIKRVGRVRPDHKREIYGSY